MERSSPGSRGGDRNTGGVKPWVFANPTMRRTQSEKSATEVTDLAALCVPAASDCGTDRRPLAVPDGLPTAAAAGVSAGAGVSVGEAQGAVEVIEALFPKGVTLSVWTAGAGSEADCVVLQLSLAAVSGDNVRCICQRSKFTGFCPPEATAGTYCPPALRHTGADRPMTTSAKWLRPAMTWALRGF